MPACLMASITVAKAPKAPPGVEAFLGNRVHEALEWLYGEVRSCRLPGADELVAGSQVTKAEDPVVAFKAMAEEIGMSLD